MMDSPCRSPMMVGMAVETMVPSIAVIKVAMKTATVTRVRLVFLPLPVSTVCDNPNPLSYGVLLLFADNGREFLVDYSRTVRPCHRVFW